MERALIEEYFQTIDRVLTGLPQEDYAIAIALAALPEQIRGFGHVKEVSVRKAAETRADLLSRLVPARPALRKAG